jgi:hypothetical protein
MRLAVVIGRRNNRAAMSLQVEDFQSAISEALRNYEKFVVCVEKTPEEFLKSLQSLTAKAIQAYEHRAPGLRHGIALDRHVTIMLSESDGPRPLCAIYFNLHTPYRKAAAKTAP